MTTVQDQLIENHPLYLRDFIWRHDITPYRILIAEFMLHRTKAEQVEPVYREFLKTYPDVESLSQVSIKDISSVTQNLGLHWRAQHFRDAAIYIRDEWDGIIPDERKKLLKIPGVGDYAAGAILTICFKKREYVIDSNIARFINRYFDLNLSGEIRRLKIIREHAVDLFNYRDTSGFLFALLDFCALICKPISPICANCPVKSECRFNIYRIMDNDAELYAAERGNMT